MNNIKIHKPLVSIIVISYNSSAYILETLLSAKAQTYPNLELIISDDCSKDNTVELCRDWLNKNKERFVRAKLLTVDKNTGVSPNCNRGFKAAHGEWIKPIAGDDILLPNCISRLMEYIETYDNISFLCSDAEIFGDELNTKKTDSNRIWLNNSITRIKLSDTPKKQYKQFKIQNMVCSPSSMLKRKTFNSLGGFDEEIKLLEDYPFWIKATRNGHKVMWVNEILVRYRVNNNTVQKNTAYPMAFELVLQKYIFKNILYHIIIQYIDQLNINSKDKILCNILKYTAILQRMLWIFKRKRLNYLTHYPK